MRMMNIFCLIALLIVISGCAQKAPAAEDKGLVAEQRGEIEVEVPSSDAGADMADEPLSDERVQASAKPYTAEEKAAYLKIEAEFLCESMTKDPGQQQDMADIAKKYGLTLDRMTEITNQLTKAVAMREVGNEAAKMCPEAFAPPQID
jgi:hypothetical protein